MASSNWFKAKALLPASFKAVGLFLLTVPFLPIFNSIISKNVFKLKIILRGVLGFWGFGVLGVEG